MLKFLLCLQVSLLAYITHVSHPFIASLIVITMSLVTGVVLGLNLSSWMCLSIFLIFLGGMMVIFLYFTSLSNNEKSNEEPFFFKLWALGLIVLLLPTCTLKSVSFKPLFLNFFTGSLVTNMGVVIYLLLTLVVVVELCQSFKGSLEAEWY